MRKDLFGMVSLYVWFGKPIRLLNSLNDDNISYILSSNI